MQTQERQSHRRGSHKSKERRFHCRSSQPPESLQNDCNDDGLYSIQDCGGCRKAAETHVDPCEERDDDGCRTNEATSSNEQSYPYSAQVDNVYGQFARTRARNKVARAEQVKESLTRKPPSEAHTLIFHYCDMSRRASQNPCPYTQKIQSQHT